MTKEISFERFYLEKHVLENTVCAIKFIARLDVFVQEDITTLSIQICNLLSTVQSNLYMHSFLH